jgi:tRNA G26 N,N-dimethylase Trm1
MLHLPLYHKTKAIIKMIEIFKTDIKHKEAKKQVLTAIQRQWPGIVATIDLEDIDKVLRVVGAWAPIPKQEIIDLLKNKGFICEILND